MQAKKDFDMIEEVDLDDEGRRNRRIAWIISVGVALILATLTTKAEPQDDAKGEVIATFGIVRIIKMPPPEYSGHGP